MLFSLLSLVSLAIACADHELHARDGSAHTHLREKREYPQVPLHTTDTPVTLSPPYPYRDLVWGDFNVIHTTDTHGWLLGHQKDVWPEPNYSGTLGDFASFVSHMKAMATKKGVDLLLVDSGDIHDGTGLSDGYPAGGVDGHNSSQFLLKLPYDLMTIGNHELTNYAVTLDMYNNFVPNMTVPGRYLTSNVNITLSNGTSVPVGNRFVKFNTTNNRRVTSLSVIISTFRNAKNTTVQPVEEMVEEQWFKDVINANDTDVFVLVGHMPVSCDKWPVVFNAIRASPGHSTTPILIFGGHTHIRDCQQYDGRSMALESGHYMDTIGWMSANLNAAKGNTNDIGFTRRYMDQNKLTYQYHTNTNDANFSTPDGHNITVGLNNLSAAFNLSYFYGTAPQTYTWAQSPYTSNGSVLNLFIQYAAPLALALNNPRNNTPNIIITNSMVLRYDIFQGPFTKNDQLTAAPYADAFVFIANVPASVAKQVLPVLNGDIPSKRSLADQELWGSGPVEGTDDLTPGYSTMDNCTGAGDDTLHSPIPQYYTPAYIGSNPPSVSDDTPIDLVFLEFIENKVLQILNGLTSTKYTTANVSSYTTTTTNQVLELYAQHKWNSTAH